MFIFYHWKWPAQGTSTVYPQVYWHTLIPYSSVCELHVAVDRSICPDIHWCYRLFYKSRQSRSADGHNRPSLTRDVYTKQRIDSAEESLRRCVGDWCARIQHSPHLFVPVIERLVSESEQVTSDLRSF